MKTKNLLVCFEINSMFWTSVHGFFPDLSRTYDMIRVIAGLPRARSARGTEPHTHGIWSTSFRLVVT